MVFFNRSCIHYIHLVFCRHELYLKNSPEAQYSSLAPENLPGNYTQTHVSCLHTYCPDVHANISAYNRDRTHMSLHGTILNECKVSLEHGSDQAEPGHHFELTPAVEEQGISSFTTDNQAVIIQPGVANVVLIRRLARKACLEPEPQKNEKQNGEMPVQVQAASIRQKHLKEGKHG